MTGHHEVFIDLDTSARGMMRFGDESKVKIHGIRSIVFTTSTMSRCSATQSCVLASWMEIKEGVLRIWDRRHQLLIKV